MTMHLSPARLFDSALPEHHQQVAGNLEALLALLEADPASVEASELTARYDRCLSGAAELIDPSALGGIRVNEIGVYFARAAIAWARLPSCLSRGLPAIDTTTTGMLSRHFPGGHLASDAQVHLAKVLDAVATVTGLDAEQLETVRQSVKADAADLDRRGRVLDALRRLFDLGDVDGEDAGSIRSRAACLFRGIYPQIPVQSEDLHVIATSQMIIFLCDFERANLGSAETTAETMSSITEFFTPRYSNFPSFGLLRPSSLHGDLVATISDLSGLSAEIVTAEIVHSVSVLPVEDGEKYVVHDIIGHGPQAVFFDFEQPYREVDDLDPEFRLSTDLGDLRVRDLLRYRPFDRARVTAHIEKYVRRRVSLVFAPVLAEMLADLAEFRIRRHSGESSSRFARDPALLDLSLMDTRNVFALAVRPLRDFASATIEDSLLFQDLIDRTVDREVAQRSVAELQAIIQPLFDAEGVLCYPDSGESLLPAGTALLRSYLNTLCCHAVLVRAANRLLPLDELTPAPLSVFDLLAFVTASFYEQHRSEHLWCIDEFLERHGSPLAEEFLRELGNT